MGFPESNLPSLDGQRYYIVVQKLSAEDLKTISPCSQSPIGQGRFVDTRVYYGSDITISRDYRDDVLLSVKWNLYLVHFDNTKQQYAADTQYLRFFNVYAPQHEQTNTEIIRRAQTVLYYAPSPVERAEEIHQLLRTIYADEEATDEASYLLRLTIQALLERKENSFNRIDRAHVKLQLRNNTVDNLHKYIDHTYVNVVYDCNTICSQAVLSDRNNFESFRHYGLLCTHRLLEFSGLLDISNTSLLNSTTNAPTTQQSCNICIQHILPIISAIMAFSSFVVVFTKLSSKRAAAIRSYVSRFIIAISSVYKTQDHADDRNLILQSK